MLIDQWLSALIGFPCCFWETVPFCKGKIIIGKFFCSDCTKTIPHLNNGLLSFSRPSACSSPWRGRDGLWGRSNKTQSHTYAMKSWRYYHKHIFIHVMKTFHTLNSNFFQRYCYFCTITFVKAFSVFSLMSTSLQIVPNFYYMYLYF